MGYPFISNRTYWRWHGVCLISFSLSLLLSFFLSLLDQRQPFFFYPLFTNGGIFFVPNTAMQRVVLLTFCSRQFLLVFNIIFPQHIRFLLSSSIAFLVALLFLMCARGADVYCRPLISTTVRRVKQPVDRFTNFEVSPCLTFDFTEGASAAVGAMKYSNGSRFKKCMSYERR